MNSLVAQLTGRRPLKEDDTVPLPAIVAQPSRRNRRFVQRRTAAAIMGIGEAEVEDDETIIPDDAEELQNMPGVSGIRLDKDAEEQDQEPPEPDTPTRVDYGTEPLLSPKDALVAPDVTPHALEPIDPSEVPAAKGQPEQHAPPRFVQPERQTINPMDVLLGRRTSPSSAPAPQPDNVVTAESAQAAVNAVLNPGGGGEALLNARTPMPDPKPGDATKIMEAFSKYGPKPTWNF